MKAAVIRRYGPPDVINIEDVPKPSPGRGEVLVRVLAAGVAPWDAIVRSGKSGVASPLPLTPGSDLSGVVDSVGSDVIAFKPGDEVFGLTNSQFCGSYAEYSPAKVNMIARKPARLSFVEAASVPVVAIGAWQMLFEYAKVQAGQSVLILGGAGNVGAYAVQLAAQAGVKVIATAGSKDLDYVRGLGAETALDFRSAIDYSKFSVDAVLDLAGDPSRTTAARAVKPNGIVVSLVAENPLPAELKVRSTFFYVDVTTERLNRVSDLIERGKLHVEVGTVLPLDQVRLAHQMLAGAPHKRGKIVLQIGSSA